VAAAACAAAVELAADEFAVLVLDVDVAVEPD
jgi:hypothetical protein